MTTIPQIAEAMQRVLTTGADEIARQTGFVQRKVKLSGSTFVQALVFGWLDNPAASLSGLTGAAAAVGVPITNQGLDQRFTPAAAACLKEVLEAAVAEVVSVEPAAIPLFQRFNGVFVQDSSIVALPNDLAEVWKGCGGNPGVGQAAVKIQVRLDLSQGGLDRLQLEDGCSQDKGSTIQVAPLPAGSLRLADLGYFSLERMRELAEQGVFYLSRLQPQTVVFDKAGRRLDLVKVLMEAGDALVDRPVELGIQQRLPCRLLAVRVPPAVAAERRRRLHKEARRRGQTVSKRSLAQADWTILATNAPVEKLSVREALVLIRVRWQIELLFKLWKERGKIDEWRTSKRWRILCEIYAKLIAVVIQHWLTLVGIWAYPDRSLVKASQIIRQFALTLAIAMRAVISLITVLETIQTCLASGCRMNRRKGKPNTYQLLLDLPEAA